MYKMLSRRKMPIYKFLRHYKEQRSSLFIKNGDFPLCINCIYFIKDTNNQLKLVAESKQCDIARIYKFVTLILSMKPDEHEFKVMGLAPYSKFNYAYTIYKDVFEGLLVVKDCKISFKKRPKDIFEYLTTKLNRYRFDSIAAAVQIFVEKLVSELFYQVYKKYKVTSFCLSGGVSMNDE